MRITNEADYALRIMRCLASISENNGVLDAASVSSLTDVSPKFTLKILRKLMNGGLVKSFKGVNGGYKLARNPDEITMREMVEVIDGPLTINKCLNSEYECSRNSHDKGTCFFHHVFDDINVLIAEKLQGITLQMAIENIDKTEDN